MEAISWPDVVKTHVEKFGVGPKITGAAFFRGKPLIQAVYESIERGEKYEEEEVPKDVLI